MLPLLLTIATFMRPLLRTSHRGIASSRRRSFTRRSCLVRAASEQSPEPIYAVSDPLCPEDGERDGCGVPEEECMIAEYSPRLLTADETTAMLNDLELNARTPLETPPRGVFCTRSLDLKDIKCIGYDMDYTLIDYKMEVWEERAYHYSLKELQRKGFPVRGLVFNPELVFRGLIIDKDNGNVLKVGSASASPLHPDPSPRASPQPHRAQGGPLRVCAAGDARHAHALPLGDLRAVRAQPGGRRPARRALVIPQHALLGAA